jgi:4,5-DOPA dioxygenase extradiol
MELKSLEKFEMKGDGNSLPVVFVGHGSPMNAIEKNGFTESLSSLGKSLKDLTPAAILVISAHWLTQGTYVNTTPFPKTIHDFQGFPDELYQVHYSVPGAPDAAQLCQKQIESIQVIEDKTRGLDHGAWSILKHLFPDADIPVFQMSIDYRAPARYHFNLAEEIKSLRKRGFLIIGSGNIVHNLYRVDFSRNPKPYDWAIAFDEMVKTKILKRDFNDLIEYQNMGNSAALAVPTNDHYLPMIYCLGLADKNDEFKFTWEEIQNSSISMRCFQVG